MLTIKKVDNNLKAEKSETAISSGIKTATKNKFQSGAITEEQATVVLQELLGYDDEKAYWIIDEWSVDVKNADDEDYDYSVYDSFVEAVESGNRADIQNEIDRHLENGHSKESLSSALTKHYKKRYMSIDSSDKRELEALEKDMIKGYGYLDKEKDSNDLYWTFKEWGSDDEDYAKYNDFENAVRTGKNINNILDEYLDHGVTKKTLAGQITKTFKQEYIELYRTDKAEASALRRRLLDAYVALGYDRDDKADDIADWLE